MEKAFKPLKLNTCPLCHKPALYLVEKELTVFSLRADGFKHEWDEDNSDYDAKIICGNCHEEFDADTIGNIWFIADSRPVKANRNLVSYNPFDKRG